jgi:hypothetical protein
LSAGAYGLEIRALRRAPEHSAVAKQGVALAEGLDDSQREVGRLRDGSALPEQKASDEDSKARDGREEASELLTEGANASVKIRTARIPSKVVGQRAGSAILCGPKKISIWLQRKRGALRGEVVSRFGRFPTLQRNSILRPKGGDLTQK